MATAIEHYERLLAEHYTWMSGGLDNAVARNRTTLLGLGVQARGGGARAIDLGAGSGAQSLALAQLGFEVWAVDSSEPLLAELGRHESATHVRCVHADMTDLARYCPEGGVDLIVCMGDSLLHLRSRSEMAKLLSSVPGCLRPGGEVVVSFRDLTPELKGTDRILPVQNDADRIMTCFLEYFPNHVIVHDTVYTRTDGDWTLAKSAYPKLRLGAQDVRRHLEAAGLQVGDVHIDRGLVTIQARRPEERSSSGE